MNKPTTDFDLLRLIDALRPRDYRVTIIAPDGRATDSPKFATSTGAALWTKANANPDRDVVMTHFAASHERN
jgi:hypothetical protein